LRHEAAFADLSRRAAAFGRREAEIQVEPPPLPARRARETMLAIGQSGEDGSSPGAMLLSH
jgi:hypothetical protein